MIAFLFVTAALLFHGYAWTYVVTRRGISQLLRVLFALPIAAVANVLVVWLLTVVGIAFTPLTIGIGHLIGIALTIVTNVVRTDDASETQKASMTMMQSVSRGELMLRLVCAVILSMQLVFVFAHAVLLPSFQYDSATNWTMRSRLSFEDKHMAFDRDETRGMAKPQYPFLFHALQVTANQGQQSWNDYMANGILFLLAISALIAVYLVIRSVRGTTFALLSITLTTSIPLLTMHLAQGYGDIVLIEYTLLSIACLGAGLITRKNYWLIFSAIFVSGAVWSKSEGLFFALFPWLVTLAWIAYRTGSYRTMMSSVITTLALSLPWPIFLLVRGLSFTPHESSDLRFGLRMEGVQELPEAMFSRGSFGPLWYLLPIAIGITLWLAKKRSAMIDRTLLPLLLWGGIVFVEVLVIYTCTPNVAFLLNAQSFYRQLIGVGGLFIIALLLIWKPSVSAHGQNSVQ